MSFISLCRGTDPFKVELGAEPFHFDPDPLFIVVNPFDCCSDPLLLFADEKFVPTDQKIGGDQERFVFRNLHHAFPQHFDHKRQPGNAQQQFLRDPQHEHFHSDEDRSHPRNFDHKRQPDHPSDPVPQHFWQRQYEFPDEDCSFPRNFHHERQPRNPPDAFPRNFDYGNHDHSDPHHPHAQQFNFRQHCNPQPVRRQKGDNPTAPAEC